MKNSVTLIGYVGQNPSGRTFPDGGQIADLSLATEDGWKDPATGEYKKVTDWHSVKFSGKLANVALQYCKKGSLILVDGKLKTQTYTDREGTKRRQTFVKATLLKLMPNKQKASPAQTTPEPVPVEEDDDLPF